GRPAGVVTAAAFDEAGLDDLLLGSDPGTRHRLVLDPLRERLGGQQPAQTPEHRRGRGAVVRGGEVAGVDVQRSVWIIRGDVAAACALGTQLAADGDQAGIRLDLHAAPAASGRIGYGAICSCAPGRSSSGWVRKKPTMSNEGAPIGPPPVRWYSCIASCCPSGLLSRWL